LSHHHKGPEAVFQEKTYVIGMATKIKLGTILYASHTSIAVVAFTYTSRFNYKLLKTLFYSMSQRTQPRD